jgi:hypothetical protein
MAKETESTTIAPIVTYWTRDDSTKKTAKIEMAARLLQSNAETYLLKAQQEELAATEAYAKAKESALKTPDFGALVQAKIRVATAELTLTKARAVYVELFAGEPRL